MSNLKNIQNRFFNLHFNSTDEEFNAICMDVFHYQLQHNLVYQQYVSNLKTDIHQISHYHQIPFLPIEFFKTQRVVSSETTNNTICFTSSGTTGQQVSKHYVNDIQLYETSFLKGFELFYGKAHQYCILALLPNYLEREGSSLVYMCNHLINLSKHPMSGFYLHNLDELIKTIETLKSTGQHVLLIGVSYALLDLAEKGVSLNHQFIVMETGGMKGKRKELLKEELHQILKEKLQVETIHSEYGMTELLSQAYSKQNGVFTTPPWMKILIRDVHDPKTIINTHKSGGINVIDLANLNSVSFIETKDLGKTLPNHQFEILGRFDNSDIRGCNLMVQ